MSEFNVGDLVRWHDSYDVLDDTIGIILVPSLGTGRCTVHWSWRPEGSIGIGRGTWTEYTKNLVKA